ncbi:MAG: hypothetical protein M9894_04660 [Planctomycetes bacterium]|nr:hypothetical protein [Planctomycetota bacterium]
MPHDFTASGGARGASGVADVGSDALRFALATLAAGVRALHGDALQDTPREEMLEDLSHIFGGPDELKGALEEAFERSLQTLVIGLKQAWLVGSMETADGRDLCEAFGEHLRGPFAAESGLEGRLFIDFLDGFFLDYDTAREAGTSILGLPDMDGPQLFAQLLDAAAVVPAHELAARATEAIQRGLLEHAQLEEEHPIIRFGCWQDLLADGLHWHFTDVVRGHPSWSRYLDATDPERLDRVEARAIASRDDEGRERVALLRDLGERRALYQERTGEVLPNREWLFDIADRLEETEEAVESDLLKGKPISGHDLPKIVAAAVAKIHDRLGTTPVGRLSDAMAQPAPGAVDVLRRARRDFRRSHWQGPDYGDAALQLAGALLPLVGPRAAERYYREAAAFGADRATAEYGLFLVELFSQDFPAALEHLKVAASLSPERFAPFDLGRYPPRAILGAGGGGPVFLVDRPEGEAGEEAVVKCLWDAVRVVDPRPGLKPLAELARAGVGGFPRLLHLGVHLKEFPYVVTAHVEGDDLDRFREMRGGDTPGSVVAMIGEKVAGTLRDLHAAGLVHNNLKPGNVRVGAGEEGLSVTLLDPCVPNVLMAAPGRVQGVRRLLAWSRAGRVIAEAFATFTAPEVVRGGVEASSPAADVYSLGAVLYKLATGAPPRPADPALLPTALRDVVMRCLDKDAARRPSADEAQRLLEEAQALPDEPAPARRPSARAPAAPPRAEPPRPAPTAAPQVAAPDPFDDPFAAHQAEPFAAAGAADPFAPATGDPFGAPVGADPFGAPAGADPFGAPVGADPFGAPAGADPFGAPAGADPFGAPAGADPFGAPAGADPFGAPAGADPFGAPAGADPFGDPFGAPAGADPFGAPLGDPFGAPAGGDPFGAPLGDPFGAPAGADPFGAPLGDPFAAPAGADPFAMPAGFAPDPFAAAPAEEDEEEPLDPSEALALLENLMGSGAGTKKAPKPAPKKPAAPQGRPAAGGQGRGAPGRPAAPPTRGPFAAPADPFSAPAPGFADPFAAQPADPFGAAADPFALPPGAADPFAAPPMGVDPFAAAADPFAAAQGADPFAAAQGADPFAAAQGADPFAAQDDRSVSAGGLWLSEEVEQPKAPPPAPAPTKAAKPAAKAGGGARGKKQQAEDEFGLVVSGLSLPSKRDAAVQIIMRVRGMSEDEARDLCRSPVVPVIKKGTKAEVDEAEALFKEAKIQCRVTTKKKRT